MTQARININPDKFNLILTQRGLKKGELAVEMGHGRNYFSDIVRRRTMPRPAVVYLQRQYNIDPKEYQVVEEEVKETKESKPEIPISELTDKQLYRVIYCAVYHAAKKAMEEM